MACSSACWDDAALELAAALELVAALELEAAFELVPALPHPARAMAHTIANTNVSRVAFFVAVIASSFLFNEIQYKPFPETVFRLFV